MHPTPALGQFKNKEKVKASCFIIISPALKSRSTTYSSRISRGRLLPPKRPHCFIHLIYFFFIYLIRFVFTADASPLNGVCSAGRRIMGEGSLDDQLRGEVMWSSFTDAVDMSNSSSSLSTLERHSNAPGSVRQILKPTNQAKNQKDIREMWIWSQYGIYMMSLSILR